MLGTGLCRHGSAAAHVAHAARCMLLGVRTPYVEYRASYAEMRNIAPVMSYHVVCRTGARVARCKRQVPSATAAQARADPRQGSAGRRCPHLHRDSAPSAPGLALICAQTRPHLALDSPTLHTLALRACSACMRALTHKHAVHFTFPTRCHISRARTHTDTNTHARARAHTHTDTNTHARTHTHVHTHHKGQVRRRSVPRLRCRCFRRRRRSSSDRCGSKAHGAHCV
jgi:hypothetical protein